MLAVIQYEQHTGSAHGRDDAFDDWDAWFITYIEL